jgi:hypothetical protein
MDGRSISSHDSEKFRTISMEKQGGMALGFRKTATDVIKPDRGDVFARFHTVTAKVAIEPVIHSLAC